MLQWGPRSFGADELVVMAVLNRTPDSFYDRGATYPWEAALARVEQVVAEGADVLDIGGVKAGPGDPVDATAEIDRTAQLVAAVAAAHPQLVISVDTWRSDVARVLIDAGAHVLNDTWGGPDPRLAEVAAATGAGLVCAHAGGLAPRTRPHRVTYDDVMAHVRETVAGLAERAVGLGARPDGIVVDPAHDFGKNSRHSLELTRRLPELVADGRPVLVALSRKDFLGELLDLPPAERLEATLAATALSAWQGARLFRTHDVQATRRVLDTVAGVRGTADLRRAVRGLA